jgi:hypothetical protein
MPQLSLFFTQNTGNTLIIVDENHPWEEQPIHITYKKLKMFSSIDVSPFGTAEEGLAFLRDTKTIMVNRALVGVLFSQLYMSEAREALSSDHHPMSRDIDASRLVLEMIGVRPVKRWSQYNRDEYPEVHDLFDQVFGQDQYFVDNGHQREARIISYLDLVSNTRRCQKIGLALMAENGSLLLNMEESFSLIKKLLETHRRGRSPRRRGWSLSST